MKLSIIVPVYNVRSFLPGCLRSLAEQGVDDCEVILVDDGSTDGSGALCDEAAAANPALIVIHQPNGGLSAARNSGLRRATGDLITFVDSDDRLGLYTLRDNLRWFADRPELSIVEYPARCYEGSDHEALLSFSGEYVDRDVFADWLCRRGYEHCYVWNKIYRAALWQDLRFPEGEVFEDTAVMPQLMQRATAVYYSARGCYHYLWRPGSISRTLRYADSRRLYLNNRALYDQGAAIPAARRSLRPLRHAMLCRLVDMGHCADCDRQDYQALLAALPSHERAYCRLRLLMAPRHIAL